jgi:hypothetical protein
MKRPGTLDFPCTNWPRRKTVESKIPKSVEKTIADAKGVFRENLEKIKQKGRRVAIRESRYRHECGRITTFRVYTGACPTQDPRRNEDPDNARILLVHQAKADALIENTTHSSDRIFDTRKFLKFF